MPKIIRNIKPIGEQVKERNLYSDVELQKDKDSLSQSIDTQIKTEGVSPSAESAMHRKVIKKLLDILREAGLVQEECEEFKEFDEYFTKIEEIKKEIKEQSKNSK